MLKINLFTKHRFETKKKAREFFTFLNKSIFTPSRFGDYETAREKFDAKDLEFPVELLSGAPEYRSGEIFLKSEKPKSLMWIRWSVSGISEWYFEIDDKYFKKPEQVPAFIEFLAKLCETFPVVFGGAAPEEDWEAKHWLTEEDEEGETSQKLGLSLESCLPGIYWITIFGEELIKHFGKKKLEQLDVHRFVEAAKEALLFIVRENPFHPDQPERLAEDKKIAREIGADYFFDIDKPKRKCRKLPVSADSGFEESETEAESDESETDVSDAEEFENQVVKSVDGEVFTEPDSLAETFVVYLHSDLKNIGKYSEAALKSLDKHFAGNPPDAEYNKDFLYRSFVPALGAYLGKVLVGKFKGKWNLRKPLLKSTVSIGKKEIFPFREAFRAVFEQGSLMSILQKMD